MLCPFSFVQKQTKYIKFHRWEPPLWPTELLSKNLPFIKKSYQLIFFYFIFRVQEVDIFHISEILSKGPFNIIIITIILKLSVTIQLFLTFIMPTLCCSLGKMLEMFFLLRASKNPSRALNGGFMFSQSDAIKHI